MCHNSPVLRASTLLRVLRIGILDDFRKGAARIEELANAATMARPMKECSTSVWMSDIEETDEQGEVNSVQCSIVHSSSTEVST